MKKPKQGSAKTGPLKIVVRGKEREFDIDDPKLPDWIEKRTLTTGGYPYDKKMKGEDYDEELEALQIELVKLQAWLQATGSRVLIAVRGPRRRRQGRHDLRAAPVYEPAHGAQRRADQADRDRDAGNGISSAMSRICRRAGEFVIFDRSWYNRAGVEPVMGFCTPEQHEHFLEEAPHFERMIVNDGIHFFKFWLDIGRETQLKRFHDRRHSPLKNWKFSPIDIAGIDQMGRLHRSARPDVRAHAIRATRRGSSCAPTTSAARGLPPSGASCCRCPMPGATRCHRQARPADHRRRASLSGEIAERRPSGLKPAGAGERVRAGSFPNDGAGARDTRAPASRPPTGSPNRAA